MYIPWISQLCAQFTYHKIAGKTKPNAWIYLNLAIIGELCWPLHYIDTAPPICIFSAVSWEPAEARSVGIHQLEAFTDAFPTALAYYFPFLQLAYHACLPHNAPANTIFWFEALAVCLAIHHAAHVWACDFVPKLNCLLVFMDNMNTVDMFNSLHAKPPYNPILISTINVCTSTSLDVHMTHVPGDHNIVADVISGNNFPLAFRLIPNLTIYTFTPPQDALGACLQ
jgi:hypothetical protein